MEPDSVSAPPPAFSRQRSRLGGAALDAVSLSEQGLSWGFDIARLATTVGFDVAAAALRATAGHAERVGGGLNPLASTLRNFEDVVGVAHVATRVGQDAVHSFSKASLTAARSSLEASGAREGELLRLALGEEASESLLTVIEMVRRFCAPMAGVPLPRLIAAARAWNAVQQAGAEVRLTLGPAPLSAELPEHAERWMRFAAASFGSAFLAGMADGISLAPAIRARAVAASGGGAGEQALASAQVTGSVKVLSFVEHSSEIFVPGYMVAVDYEVGCVVVALRGTSSARDALVDLVCEPTELELGGLRGFAHGGMLRAAQHLARPLAEAAHRGLEELTRSSAPGDDTVPPRASPPVARPRVVLCGHSLGAGVAALIAALWRDSGEMPCEVQCVAFACPQVLDASLSQALCNHTTSIVLGDDLVPRLSLSTVQDLREAFLRLNDPQAFHLPADLGTDALLALASQSSENRVRLAAAHTSLRAAGARVDAGRLFPAGRIIILPVAANTISLSSTARGPQDGGHADVDELRLSQDMASAHMPGRYIKALQEATGRNAASDPLL
ncbi:unnamed protein product [Polarella glacialis]|uniref:sn-1-specific diacylglycerol lipase n=1 Tax=Polarella glacialis TaxID=89957 RepID=A0A813EEA9_POLGL|nr:unnamed protein product [Polarella glacialis]